jgi:hypothetical protein
MNGGIAERQLSPREGTGTSIWTLDNDTAFYEEQNATRSHICRV